MLAPVIELRVAQVWKKWRQVVDKGGRMAYGDGHSAEPCGVEPGPEEKEPGMKVRIEDTCTACGLCCDTCPEVFEMGDEMATVIVDEVPAHLEEAAQQAADECPVGAIIIG